MHIEQLMSQPPITCKPEGTLDAAARLMWDHDCGGVIVVGDQRGLVRTLAAICTPRSRDTQPARRATARPRQVSAPVTA